MSGHIFLTGANGFIGRRLAPKLARRGYEVVCLVRDPEKAPALKTQGVRLVQGDITERESMREAMKGAAAVFHVAGWYAIGANDDKRMYAINVDGARNTLGLAAELGVPKILHTSTVGVFGNTHGRLVDESFRVPKDTMVSAYEVTKWVAHYEVAEPLQKKGAPVILVLPGGVTGAGDEAPHVLALRMFLSGSPVMMGAKSGITFAHAEDVAEGHILAFEKGRSGEAYILAGDAITYRRLFELCERITGRRGARLWAPGWTAELLSGVLGATEAVGLRLPFTAEGLKAMDDYTYWATAAKARGELGWATRPMEETLKETLDYLEMRRRKG